MLYSLIFRKIIAEKVEKVENSRGCSPGFPGSTHPRGVFIVGSPFPPRHGTLRFHKPSQSCNLLVPSSGERMDFLWISRLRDVWEEGPRSKSGTEKHNPPGLRIFFLVQGNPKKVGETCERLETYENHPLLLANTNIPHPKKERSGFSNPWGLIWRGWDDTDWYLWMTEVEEQDKIEPYMFSHPIALKLNAAMEGVTPAGSDLVSMNKNLAWWVHKWPWFFLGRGVFAAGWWMRECRWRKGTGLLDSFGFVLILIDSWTHTKHIYRLEWILWQPCWFFDSTMHVKYHIARLT